MPTTKRQRKTKDPCLNCRLHKERCICALIPRLHTRTRLCLVVHSKELKRTTNTGRLAVLSLVNSEMRVRGDQKQSALDLSDLLTPDFRSFLFFPSEDAVELSTKLLQENHLPIQLIVPDGNWRQASKVNTRHTELKDIVRVKISKTNMAKQHLRAEHMPEGMATLEAIAHAMGICEGAKIQEELLKLYTAKLSATLKGRGKHCLDT